MGLLATLDRLYPFLVIGLAIVLSCLRPQLACSYCDAPLRPELTVWWGVIPGIFLCEGLTLPRGAMLAAARRLREHVFVQTFNFMVMPLSVSALALPLVRSEWLPPTMHDGFLAFACVPTTTSMCVMHTAVSGGNVPLAAFNAVLGNSLAIVISPWLLSHLLKVGTVDYRYLATSLVGKMVLPLLLGQVLQPKFLPSGRTYVIKFNQTLIGLLLWQVISDVVYHGGEIDASTVLRTVGVMAILHVTFLSLSWSASGVLGMGVGDRIGCLFSSSHKTVVLGLPLLRTVFTSRSQSSLVMLLFPLIVYHLFQLVFDLVLGSYVLSPLSDAAKGMIKPLLASEKTNDKV